MRSGFRNPLKIAHKSRAKYPCFILLIHTGQTSLVPHGNLRLDILKDKRVGGVEFLGVLLGGKLKDTECRVNVIVHDSTDRKKPIKSAVVSVLDKKQKTTWVGTADFTFSD